ncbi:ADP-glyceromanno-heptose 6-epimerase [Acetobacter lambici]|uniref:ADP-L-glycero-D-manno-heptose-6-epimerase n=1 Tax=Acetobacter lambici TaxID=1332824 RepID=A0ABT1EZR5_9PROT|nr:ADP-glyceromanno-heptose 6-epimerase [Acetobacter lambici]MCP1242327.1 ADP-glyceromanno-heptose 6-epimerase [Acetobacter lambici]MCP1258443.1 ADP-glyceromanno-heptose 6-epimerase [Acetobacter lambici]NHO56809.1 ADP-glyceromanno-heptose 6-epimerase [Acetobacter lambici]
MAKRLIVTGGAGFIGSNIIHALNQRGLSNIIAVDNLTNGDKALNLSDLAICDYVDKDVFYDALLDGHYGPIDTIFHEGACSATTEHDGRYMMASNYEPSKKLLTYCQRTGTRLLYASSAATYGASTSFTEDPAHEKPLNVYGYSKLLFDQIVRRALPGLGTQVAGFRYFNVYGPREQHKGGMASVAFHNFNQFMADGCVRLFGQYGACQPGEQMRDFIAVNDLVATKLWFFDNPGQSGVFNLGTGRAQPFNDVAAAVVNTVRAHRNQPPLDLAAMVRTGVLEYTPFPDKLRGRYQCFTQADMRALRGTGCNVGYADVAHGVADYVRHLLRAQPGHTP